MKRKPNPFKDLDERLDRTVANTRELVRQATKPIIREEKPKYSADTIRRYRELDANKGFERPIKKRTPFDLTRDEVKFSCGHKDIISVRLIDNMPKDVHFSCDQCTQEWLAKEGGLSNDERRI